MRTQRIWFGSAMVLTAVALLACSAPAWAGHGGGGMHGGGGFHGGGGMHAGGFANPHPYRPSQAHFDEHNGGADSFAHNDHHQYGWHNGAWGPGFWGGAAVGYGLGAAYAPWGWGDGGDTYVDNSTYVAPTYDDSGAYTGDDSSDYANVSAAAPAPAPNTAAASGFPTDEWPELGITTYAGQYGGSQGQVVVRIVPNSAAAKAGFVPGDVIVSLNDHPTPSADALDQVLESAQGQFSAQVWDARTGRTSLLSGNLDANNAPAPSQPIPSGAVSQQ